MFALKRKLDFLRCIREPRNYGLSLQDSKSLEKATKIRLEKKCTSLRNRCFSLFLFFFECFCKGLRKFATGLPSFPSLEKSLSSIQYRQYCSSRRVRLVYPTNFLFLQVVGSVVLCIGVWLAVDKTSFIHLTKFSQTHLDQGVQVIIFIFN